MCNRWFLPPVFYKTDSRLTPGKTIKLKRVKPPCRIFFIPKFKIVPLSKEYAEKIRNTRQDDFGHRVIEQVATGHGPCRVSLKPFKPGRDRRLLFAHSPFTIGKAFNQPGPVFIFADEVEDYKDNYHFPPEI